jgi:general stress protein YciG
MSGTREGGLAATQTNRLKHGPDFYARLGKLGGAAGRGHKFAHGKVDPAVAGKLGGRKSRKRLTK